jgi:hypothetical protein
MAYIVSSSPGAGLRAEPSASFPSAQSAFHWTTLLSKRGMRTIRIRNTETGEVLEERGLRAEIERMDASLPN